MDNTRSVMDKEELCRSLQILIEMLKEVQEELYPLDIGFKKMLLIRNAQVLAETILEKVEKENE